MSREATVTTTTTRSVGQVPVAIVGALPADALGTPRAGVFYPSADAQGGGTLCLADGPSSEAALTAAAMPFVIPEKTGPDVGDQPPVGYAIGAPAVAVANPYFRRVLYTAPDGTGQLVVMTLQPRESIGLEAHRSTLQIIRVEAGVGTARVGNQTMHVGPGALVIVPPSVLHDVVNVSDVEPLNLTVFYTEPLHEPGTVDPLKGSAALAACQADAADAACADNAYNAYYNSGPAGAGNNNGSNNLGGNAAYGNYGAPVPPLSGANPAGWQARLGLGNRLW
ncbi:cupin motif-containing protein [Pandoravirus inopinatum]|uniref:Cupin motif-containing protein n=1 Tax=Pandoravirus inopinatum TaxID=1605721 RepID=A0A0B5JEV0_9VIRU|nr:cupin motif-containing protein [Pandoravirus inopinatum]AJF98327.1 cupin motif-containing protein [Pandoravirus inopinatum]